VQYSFASKLISKKSGIGRSAKTVIPPPTRRETFPPNFSLRDSGKQMANPDPERFVATESPYTNYRFGRIVALAQRNYSQNMKVALNKPTSRAGAGLL
jgi:hypothetical protein